MVMFQTLLNGAEPCDAGTTQLSSPVCRSGGQQDPLSICVPAESDYWREQFQTISEDVSVRNVLMHSAH